MGDDGEVVSRFVRVEGEISAHLNDIEAGVLRLIPALLTGVGDPALDRGAARLRYEVHADDPDLSAEFRRLASDIVDGRRDADVAALADSIEAASAGATISDAAAEGWVGAMNQARVVLAARLGIEAEGWDADLEIADADPSLMMLLLLSYIQNDLVDVLTQNLD